MRSQVIVTWGEPATFRIDLEEVQPMPHDQARHWLDEQFTQMGCEPIRLTGKVLTGEKILCIAQAAGQQRFEGAAHREWALASGRPGSAGLAKPIVTVDVPAQSLSY